MNSFLDTPRALAAAKAIIAGRDTVKDASKILVTAEHAFACVLLATHGNDPRKAAAMLNEALIPGIEQRLAHYASKVGGL